MAKGTTMKNWTPPKRIPQIMMTKEDVDLKGEPITRIRSVSNDNLRDKLLANGWKIKEPAKKKPAPKKEGS